jgi:hypothetical protein
MTETQEIPWKRLAVEAAAIVASILLAFAIDAGWDERQERVEEREVLESLQVEFQANRDEAVYVISFHDRVVQSFVELMELSQDEILALQPIAVKEFLSSLGNPRTFDAVRGSIDALTSSGKLGILQDRELRESLTTFVNIVDDSVEDAYYLSQSSITVWNEIARSGGPWRLVADVLTAEDCAGPRPNKNCYTNDALSFLPVATSQDLLNLRNNTLLMGYVYREKIDAVHYSAEIRQAKIQIEIVLELLEENL